MTSVGRICFYGVISVAAAGCASDAVVFSESASLSGTSVATGYDHSCAVSAGNVYCWGSNADLQLGAEGTSGSSRPLRVNLSGPAVSVGAGENFSCALLTGGDVECWGNNEFGQLGDRTTASRAQPRRVNLPSAAQSINLGYEFACAVLVSFELACWGQDLENSLGRDRDPSGPLFSADPIVVTGAYRQVSCGQGHACGIERDGHLSCWGRNSRFELGYDTAPRQQGGLPVRVDDRAGWKHVSVSPSHTCAIRKDDGVYCWGRDPNGFATEDDTLPFIETPTRYIVGSFSEVVLGAFVTCAKETDGEYVCFGRNFEGQLGLEPTSVVEPTIVPGWNALDPGRFHACGLRNGNEIHCTGQNSSGELGLGDEVLRREPMRVELVR